MALKKAAEAVVDDVTMSDSHDNHSAGLDADSIIKFINKDICDVINQLNGETNSVSRACLFEHIDRWVTSDGRTLFEYHADALLSSNSTLPTSVAASEMWNQQNIEEKAFWAQCSGKITVDSHKQPMIIRSEDTSAYTITAKLKTGLQGGQTTCLSHFKLGAFSQQTTMKAERIKVAVKAAAQMSVPEAPAAAIDELHQALETLDLKDLSKQAPIINVHAPVSTRKLEPLSRFILTETVLGGPRPQDYASAIPLILHGIRALQEQNPRLKINGRIDGVRIEYNTFQTEIPLIAARLETARTRGGLVPNTKYDDVDPWETCEWLLRPLFYWNRKALHSKVPGLKAKGGPNENVIPKKELYTYLCGDINLYVNWLPEVKALHHRFEGDWSEDAEGKVEYLMNELRTHLHGLNTDGEVLSDRAKTVVAEVDDYFEDPIEAKTSYKGLASRLRKCFDRKGLSADEYFDMLEQQFFW